MRSALLIQCTPQSLRRVLAWYSLLQKTVPVPTRHTPSHINFEHARRLITRTQFTHEGHLAPANAPAPPMHTHLLSPRPGITLRGATAHISHGRFANIQPLLDSTESEAVVQTVQTVQTGVWGSGGSREEPADWPSRSATSFSASLARPLAASSPPLAATATAKGAVVVAT